MEGIVYLLAVNGDDQLYKIGVTKGDIKTRLKKLQTGNGNELVCLKTFKSNKPYKLEKMLHNHFFMERESGEWFLLNKKQVSEFDSLCEKYQTVVDSLKDNPFF